MMMMMMVMISKMYRTQFFITGRHWYSQTFFCIYVQTFFLLIVIQRRFNIFGHNASRFLDVYQKAVFFYCCVVNVSFVKFTNFNFLEHSVSRPACLEQLQTHRAGLEENFRDRMSQMHCIKIGQAKNFNLPNNALKGNIKIRGATYSSSQDRLKCVPVKWQYWGPCGQAMRYPSTLMSVFLTGFCYFSYQVAIELSSRPSTRPYTSRKMSRVQLGIEPGTSWIAVRLNANITFQNGLDLLRNYNLKIAVKFLIFT